MVINKIFFKLGFQVFSLFSRFEIPQKIVSFFENGSLDIEMSNPIFK